MMTIARFLAKIAELVKSELARPKHDVRQGIIHKSIGKVVSQYLILFPAMSACLIISHYTIEKIGPPIEVKITCSVLLIHKTLPISLGLSFTIIPMLEDRKRETVRDHSQVFKSNSLRKFSHHSLHNFLSSLKLESVQKYCIRQRLTDNTLV